MYTVHTPISDRLRKEFPVEGTNIIGKLMLKIVWYTHPCNRLSPFCEHLAWHPGVPIIGVYTVPGDKSRPANKGSQSMLSIVAFCRSRGWRGCWQFASPWKVPCIRGEALLKPGTFNHPCRAVLPQQRHRSDHAQLDPKP